MKILVLSPHTDDAELGCGGTIVKLLNGENEIYWVVFSTAEDSLPDGLPKDTLKREYRTVTRDLALREENCKVFDFKVRNLHQYRQEILDDLVRIRNQFNPDIVIGPSLNDLHQDHQVVAHEMVRAFKTTSSIICYELPWNHVTFNTQFFCRLSTDQIERKCEILRNYQSQLLKGRQYFSKEFIFGLAKTRGIQCNAEYAEAFEVVRWML
ncbi:PIG-L deacetylase family protein [Methanosphaerula palustris]|uniref:LmbE family protein n=1 Tax=Methanosphaerula palustris (strain ATCC BAA-1556 / DSM 19958 / E1-9c) TaxID=521011 RepID=B8GGE2_METPE|nr:PIG-L family deacetylase [Methanosphaerula palustris]ACL16197.1 LmbE family protein [Methanosphaerula palustris E1-9c]